MSAPNPKKRASITLGPRLQGLLESGHCAGRTRIDRLEILAGRYLALVKLFPTWSVEQWARAIELARKADLQSPAAAWTLVGLAKQARDTKLTYALESLPPAQAFSVISIAELAPAPLPEDLAVLATFLESEGVQVTAPI